jgi:lipid A 3-O-deacylase
LQFSIPSITRIVRDGFLVLALSLPFVMAAAKAHAEKRPEDYKTFTLYFENDLFKGTDRQYTNGVKLTWMSKDLRRYRDEQRVPKWSNPVFESLPFINRPGAQRKVSFSIGQNIYTPEDIEIAELMEDDRPYAGITYLEFGFHCVDRRKMDTLAINLGMIGPHSYAEETQKIVHELVDSAEPQGWQHQLKDEPILNLFYERKWRFKQLALGNGWGVDWIPHLGAAAGNAWTGLNLGHQIRFGWNLPNDFGTFLIRPGSDTNAPIDEADPRLSDPYHRVGVHFFAGMDGRYVARYIFLDGNTFRDSHSVDKVPFVGNFIAGVGIIFHRLKVSYAHVFQTKEFYSQKDAQSYGSITFSYSY